MIAAAILIMVYLIGMLVFMNSLEDMWDSQETSEQTQATMIIFWPVAFTAMFICVLAGSVGINLDKE